MQQALLDQLRKITEEERKIHVLYTFRRTGIILWKCCTCVKVR